MTQDEKAFVLRDLCARLPYGVKVKFEYVITSPAEIIGINKFFIECEDVSADIEDVKPYLFPLSSMTEEQKVEFEKMSELDCEYITTQIKNDAPNWTSGLNRVNWLIKNHFDVYDLIPMGLAIDASGKNIY